MHNPQLPLDIELITDLRTMSHVWAGDMDIRMAKNTGQMELKGNPIMTRTISSWLRPGTFAHIRPKSGFIRTDTPRARRKGLALQSKRKESPEQGRKIYAEA